eukprot:scaffold6706_cov95-Skeletonema_marinoi.AAC.2
MYTIYAKCQQNLTGQQASKKIQAPSQAPSYNIYKLQEIQDQERCDKGRSSVMAQAVICDINPWWGFRLTHAESTLQVSVIPCSAWLVGGGVVWDKRGWKVELRLGDNISSTYPKVP